MSAMPHAIRIHANGTPDVMRWEEVHLPAPGPGEARIRHTAIGINYSDVNVRRGGFYLARPPQFTLMLGNEAAGVVTEVGHGVSTVKPGERVVYAGMRGEFYEDTGAYAEERNVPVERLIPVPPGVSDQQAAAMMVKGFTASLIINRIFMAEVLWSGSAEEKAEAIQLAESVAADAPSPTRIVEELKLQEDARADLRKWKAAS